MVHLKSPQIRDEIINCKRTKGDLTASTIFPNFSGVLQQKVFLNEWLPPPVFKLFMEARKTAKQKGYERAWVRRGIISVRKCEGAPRIDISSKVDLDNLP